MPKAPPATTKAKRRVAPAATLAELRQIQAKGKETFLKAGNTSSKYMEMVTAGRKWLAGHFARANSGRECTNEEQDAGADEDPDPDFGLSGDLSDDEPQDSFKDPEFARAFDDIPNVFSDKALALYISFKCIHQNLKAGTGASIRAAFKHLWDQVDGSTFRDKWQFNSQNKRWEGNPVKSAEVEDVMTSVKHKGGAGGGDRTHSAAMSKEYMEKMFKWSESVCDTDSPSPARNMEERTLKTKHLEFKAFSSTGWTIWARCFEMVKLKKRHLILNVSDPRVSFGAKHHILHLIDRKGWQRKLSKTQHETDLRSNLFNIYSQPDLPACDSFHWLNQWVTFLEKEHYKRPLEPDDYIFPAMGANGIIQPREPISHDTVQKYINEFTSAAGLSHMSLSFSTHCFRRGGAQYRFMFAPVAKRWNLRKTWWWGGWAEGEQRDTLMCYLLDELSSYEEDYSNALAPEQTEMNVSFMGGHHLVALVMNEALHLVHNHLSDQIQNAKAELKNDVICVVTELFAAAQLGQVPPGHVGVSPATNSTSSCTIANPAQVLSATSTTPSLRFTARASTREIIPIPLVGPAGSPLVLHAHRNRQIQSSGKKSGTPLPTKGLVIPDIPVKNADGTHPPPSESWRWIVKHWSEGDPERGLDVPLKDWPNEWLQGPNRQLFASKRNQRRMIATEFLNYYAQDEARFLEAYPVANLGHSQLFKAIETARKERGEIAARPRNKH